MNAAEARKRLADLCMDNSVPSRYWILTGEEMPANTTSSDSKVTIGVKRAQVLLRQNLSEEEMSDVLGVGPEVFKSIWVGLNGGKP